MNNNLANISKTIQEVSGFDKEWPVGTIWYLPVFTAISIISLCLPKLDESLLIWGTQFMPGHVIIPLVSTVPLGRMFKLLTYSYGNDISSEFSRKLIRSTSTDLTGTILAILFSILGLVSPWMTDEYLKWFVIAGGFIIPPLYNIVAKWYLGQSFIVSYFVRTFRKHHSQGAPFHP